MEKLTEITHRGAVHLKGTVANYSSISYGCQLEEGSKLLKEALKKLAEYENAEESGLLLRLPFPCKVGDELYFLMEDYDESFKEILVVKTVSIIDVSTKGVYSDDAFCEWGEIGKTVFLTKAEAEAKLAEMEGE